MSNKKQTDIFDLFQENKEFEKNKIEKNDDSDIAAESEAAARADISEADEAAEEYDVEKEEAAAEAAVDDEAPAESEAAVDDEAPAESEVTVDDDASVEVNLLSDTDVVLKDDKSENRMIGDLVHIDIEESDIVPVIPLRGITVYPGMVIHFDVGREKSVNALEYAMMTDQRVFLSSQKSVDTDLPSANDFYKVGTLARVKQMLRLPGNAIRVLVEGLTRGKILEITQENPFFKASIEEIPDVGTHDQVRLEALRRAALDLFTMHAEVQPKMNKNIVAGIGSIPDPSQIADIIASNLNIQISEKQKILETADVVKRLETVCAYLQRENEILGIQKDIAEKVKNSINENQKEYYLREQIKTIQKELGQDESIDDEVKEWLSKLEELNLDEKTHDKIEKEIKRMLKIQAASADAAVLRTYIEYVLDLPWNKATDDFIDLNHTKKILDEDHYGLESVKDRILEYLAVRSLSDDYKGPIICLVGPPGVGKTSIGRSIARSIGREFVRMSLGGVHDEAEIRGHRRTYVGAIPGRIVSSIKDAGVNNPLFLLDEIDKVASDYRGDPASALLEVLDPEQNRDFKDHYLDIPFDLSKVLFITTANTTDTIPRPLLDRMEVITLSGYTEEEKVKIAQRHLVAKQTKENGLNAGQMNISETAIRDIINYYTREAGVRNLERQIGNICRKSARKIAEGKKKRNSKFRVTPSNLASYLGKKKASYDKVDGSPRIGVVTGMAWTAVGGDILFIETAVMDGKGKLQLTGKLGDVMQESAKAAYSLIRVRCEKLGIDKDFYEKYDMHIHVPEGATPKDGPSAGVTMCTAIVSALTGKGVRSDIAMTGEITLRGDVLPVGGIKEKVIAAHRAGARTILLPKENEKDIEDIPQSVRDDIDFKLMETIDQVLEEAFK